MLRNLLSLVLLLIALPATALAQAPRNAPGTLISADPVAGAPETMRSWRRKSRERGTIPMPYATVGSAWSNMPFWRRFRYTRARTSSETYAVPHPSFTKST